MCGRSSLPPDQVAMLSMQKFSSNVIEKCMDRASEEVIVKYVRELADRDAMRRLLQVPFLSPGWATVDRMKLSHWPRIGFP